jgi:hypothetical protein
VQQALSREAAYGPPEAAVAKVKKAYAAAKPWTWLMEIAEFARTVFDSLQQPVPAMVRASPSRSRQLVHEAEPFVIDLRVESDPIRNRLFLVGQVLNARHPDQAVRGVDVVLLSGEELVMRTSASDSGEFDLEWDREEDLRLFINIRGQRAIGIVLPDLRNDTK